MPIPTADVVICGAGIAGIATAYQLSVKHGLKQIVLVDERAPLTLTSDKSTECYRNWWPGPGDAMVSLMNRSIDILEGLADESGNCFHLNRRGYLYATADPARAAIWQSLAQETAALGAGPLRLHSGQAMEEAYAPAPPSGYAGQPTGADLISDRALIRRHFPYLSEDTAVVMHPRRCGWFSAQQLGMYLLERARERGVQFARARVASVDTRGARVESVRLDSGAVISTPNFVIAAGPLLKEAGRLLGCELPVYCERHLKVAFDDYLGVVPRDAPLLIWSDPIRLPWADDERAALAESDETRRLLGELPAGVHMRPEGGPDSRVVLMLWTHDMSPVEPVWPLPVDPHYAEIVLRGLSVMVPALKAYLGKASRPVVDGGYYLKTRENRPLIGPLPVAGAYVIGALSGYGLMASCAASELLAAHLTDSPLPPYAPAFRLERYDDPAYQALLQNWGESGQL
ncbi:MAG: FAD-binding oxidoreductase [Chloroflexi bacterium]|nr:FAD-binding oxidoreductase [Chloroflexota bacterium]